MIVTDHLEIVVLLFSLLLDPLVVQAHLVPLLLGHDPSAMCLVSLRPDDVALFVKSHEVMVHPPDIDMLLLQVLLLLGEVDLSLLDDSSDLLTGFLRFELQLLLLRCLLLDLGLELDLLYPVVAELLLEHLEVALTGEHLILHSLRFFIDRINLRVILIVELVFAGLALIGILLESFLI